MVDAKEKTALATSVGADKGSPFKSLKILYSLLIQKSITRTKILRKISKKFTVRCSE